MPKKQDNVAELQQQLVQAQQAQLRAQADYQNLVRRNQEERSMLVKMAAAGLVRDLLQPLDHLSLAAGQLNDAGLNMVVAQFWQQLNNHGLEEINPVGQPFNVETMEAVDSANSIDSADADSKKENSDDDSQKTVTKVVTKGYKLNGEILQFARVILA